MAASPEMVRAGTLIARWKKRPDCVDPDQLARAAWRAAVGKKIDAHTVSVRLVRKHLIVGVEDQLWQRQLFALRQVLLENLERVLGPGVVEDMEFRVQPPRKTAARETLPARRPAARAAAAAAGADEADAIADPVLRRIYIRSRNRTSA